MGIFGIIRLNSNKRGDILVNNRIRDLRKKNGLTQNELALKTGLSNQSISFYENGKRSPKIEAWQKLAKFFNVSVSYLQGDSNLSDPQLSNLITELTNDANTGLKKHKRDTFTRLFNIIKSSEYAYQNKEKINKYVDDLKNNKTSKAYEKINDIVIYTVSIFELGLKASSGDKEALQKYKAICKILDNYFGNFGKESHY